ncbi:2-oxo-4-hydroxy-4-carboxy-5-ureidoimidazoline decarboxylase [Saccharopolyspora rhizosphaerae]|uniref:2-oxo-4-hydroxy-4-carboxy-5-ureidoimidazoline decarboxylase n=1 Tax=Saccharopolyspora rhizosphaerae TaxID=2492662 RepID=A0A3R8PY53_9PSEU|nr:2-oxo-4-hydroxy-4-carboxy-5-ureidoimidazoline decarboxylase [Saccharopolyspora rhizosphaerae]RRO12901.1 2-oxo-4-hydroxy-4-carboxy-5-ureidoimidazoline decarboxylase [Saccharopolyspora rhizosphaerae]
MATTTGVQRLNDMPRAELIDTLLSCLDITRWAADIADARPFADADAVQEAAAAAAPDLTDAELAQALAAHPRIGERPANTGRSAEFSRREQAGVSEGLAEELRVANLEYERRFGHVYLVCASGRSGEELLEVLRSRLDNDPDDELRVVESELRKIAALRLTGVIEA